MFGRLGVVDREAYYLIVLCIFFGIILVLLLLCACYQCLKKPAKVYYYENLANDPSLLRTQNQGLNFKTDFQETDRQQLIKNSEERKGNHFSPRNHEMEMVSTYRTNNFQKDGDDEERSRNTDVE